MNEIPTGGWPAWISSVGFELGWKSSALLAAVGLVVLATRRRPTIAAAVANAGLVALLVLPFTVVLLPPLAVACLPAVHESASASQSVIPPPVIAVPPPQQLRFLEGIAPQDIRMDIPAAAPIATSDRVGPAPDRSHAVDLAIVMASAYLLVVAAFLTRLGLGLTAVRRLRRQAVAADEPNWLRALEAWRRRLGIRTRVGLSWSSGVSVPVAVGWRRPMVILPATAAALETSGHIDAILVHELAHIRRGDYAWNLVQRLAVAFYWGHPLAWLVARASAAARERACDDLCIHEMGGPAGYRATLLAVAAGLVRHPGPALGLAMARSPRLARRLRGIDGSRGASRCLPRGRVRLVIAATVFLAVGLVGAARLTRAQAQKAADRPKKAATDPAAGKLFHLRVVSAATGMPVPRANVRVWISLRDDWRVTDEEGRLDIRYATGPADQDFGVDVWGDGFAMQRHGWGSKPRIPVPDGDTLKLMPGETLSGLVRDEQGRPIAGATVYLWSHNYKKKDPKELLYDLRAVTGADGRWKTSGAPETTGELLGFRVDHPDFLSDRDYVSDREKPKVADLRAGKAVSVMKKGIPVVGRVVDADGHPVAGALVRSASHEGELAEGDGLFDVTTDANGAFRTGQLGSRTYYFIAKAPGHAPGEATVRVRAGMSATEIRLGRPRTLQGRVVSGAGKPVEGAFVCVDTWRRLRFLGVFLYTDEDGRFRWEDAPEDDLHINVSKQGYHHIFQQKTDPSAPDLIFTLQPSISINGVVRDAETNKRIDRAKVEFAAVNLGHEEEPVWGALPRTSVGVVDGMLNVHLPATAVAYRLRILADGFEPFVSRVFRSDEIEVSDYEILLSPARPGTAPTARAIRPDGKPLVGARVYRGSRDENHLRVSDGLVESERSSGREVRTGPDGSFPIPAEQKSWVVLILGDDCYAIAGGRAVTASGMIQAKPYARIEGRYLVGTRPGARAELGLDGSVQDDTTDYCVIFLHQSGTTDADGRFRFEKVIPGNGLRLGHRAHRVEKSRAWSLGAAVQVQPGTTAVVQLGGTGMPVVGRVVMPAAGSSTIDLQDGSYASITSNSPFIPYPLSLFRGKTSLDKEWSEWMPHWSLTPEAWDHEARRLSKTVDLAPDGSFRIEDVPPGDYRLSIRVAQPERRNEAGPFSPIVREFSVPRPAGGRSDRPLNLGTFILQPNVVLKPGDPAPAFEVTTVDGKKLSVPADFRGKVLLLDFGAPWNDQSLFQITRMNDIQARFGKKPEFALLSLILAPDTEAARKFAVEKGQPWPQAIIGSLSNPVSDAYGIHDENVPAAILIGPDGKIIAPNLPYNEMGAAVEKALPRD
ncbi:carboxypeptidase regulatory-like domain-containing protein [Aquisphaera insulae]|uniref:carboxypeptidase regulatory-like domain-containing protein n=1 Tax=Aquisphaera insulae TaxID=2712864 RepID=UPI0013EBE240|nr:carboxypeptidase regulatory-like domain-containing protein [Aquisphaera insulae]